MPDLRILVASILVAISVSPARSQTYPSKPVTIVVALAAGGAADVIARAVGQRLSEEWGEPVLIENKGGANTQVGAAYVAKAPPDGYTLLLTPEHTFTVNPFLYRRLPYDAANDFVPVSGVALIHQSLVVNPSLPMRTMQDLIAYAKAKPGQLNYGSQGVGSGSHLNMELLAASASVKLNPVQYKGAGPALADVIAGHIDTIFASIGLVLESAKAGQLRILGVGSRERLPELPDLPAISEAVPGFRATVWFGLFAPRGTPPDIVTKINVTTQRILADPGFRRRFLAPNFYEPMAGPPERLGEIVAADSAQWRKLIADSKIAVEE